MDRRKVMGMVVAGAVVGYLASGHVFAGEKTKAESEKAVKCAGINECKGKGECGAPDGSHSCAGKNECKGKGWVKVASEKECTDQKGTVIKDKKKEG